MITKPDLIQDHRVVINSSQISLYIVVSCRSREIKLKDEEAHHIDKKIICYQDAEISVFFHQLLVLFTYVNGASIKANIDLTININDS